jgi:hypothetical protein
MRDGGVAVTEGVAEVAALPGAPSYRSRRSVLEGETSWTLAPDALERSDHGQLPLLLPYRDFMELRLSYDPTRFDTRRFRCDIAARGRGRITIMSTSYVSPGNFEDRGAHYTPFVRALVARVAPAAPNCRFRAGKRPWAYWAQHAFLLTILIMLGLVLALFSGFSVSGLVAVKLGIFAFYIPIAIGYARRNLPKSFTADRIPTEVLP